MERVENLKFLGLYGSINENGLFRNITPLKMHKTKEEYFIVFYKCFLKQLLKNVLQDMFFVSIHFVHLQKDNKVLIYAGKEPIISSTPKQVPFQSELHFVHIYFRPPTSYMPKDCTHL